MNLIAAKSFRFRSLFISKWSSVVQSELCNSKRYFADVAKKEKNLYATLGVPTSATHNEIKNAYYELTKRYHPDRNENCQEAAVKFREVTEAYEILGNYALRKKYDRGIPISKEKEIVKPVVKHEAQFQEFFDSRFTDQGTDSNNARSREINDLGDFNNENRSKAEQDDAYLRDVRAVQPLVTVFILFLLVVYSRK